MEFTVDEFKEKYMWEEELHQNTVTIENIVPTLKHTSGGHYVTFEDSRLSHDVTWL